MTLEPALPELGEPPVLSLGAFRLRPLPPDDAIQWPAYLSDPRVTLHTSWGSTDLATIDTLVKRLLADYATKAIMAMGHRARRGRLPCGCLRLLHVVNGPSRGRARLRSLARVPLHLVLEFALANYAMVLTGRLRRGPTASGSHGRRRPGPSRTQGRRQCVEGGIRADGPGNALRE